jgi:UDP-2-acetamido-3-amino-2,3-dideoxy-glucuronate N-acetyltransferase
MGDNVKIQNNVSVYVGCEIEDDVFLGPSCVLTNVSNPRSQIIRHNFYEYTMIRRGATIGANATILCGITLGRYCFIAAGSVVTKNVLDYALMMGNRAKQEGWMSRHGHILKNPDSDGIYHCPESDLRYKLDDNSNLKCLDVDKDQQLPENIREAEKSYREFKMR